MKIKRYLLLVICCFIFPLFVNASGGVSLFFFCCSLYVGSSSSFKVTANNAAGKVTISVDDSSIASINQSSVFLDKESVTVKVTAKKVGSTTVKVYVNDMTTYDDEDVSGKTYTYKVTVKEKPNYSTNNKLKSISVDGYELNKSDDNNYTLTVNKDVESIKINASAEDSKAKVSNDGNHDLKIGENKIEITITSESGSKNVINVIVTRRDSFNINDLSELVNSDEVVLNLDSDTTIKKSDYDIIKNSKKKVTMNYYNDNKELLYSWILYGNAIEESSDVLTTINISEDNEELSKLNNYAKSLYIDFSYSGSIPKGTSINVNTLNVFKDGDKVKLYYYDETTKTINLVNKELTVTNNSVNLTIEHCSTYFVSKAIMVDMSKINEDGSIKEENNNSNILIYIFIGIMFIELCVIGFLLYTFKFKKEKPNNIENTNNTVNMDSPVNVMNPNNTVNAVNQNNTNNTGNLN